MHYIFVPPTLFHRRTAGHIASLVSGNFRFFKNSMSSFFRILLLFLSQLHLFKASHLKSWLCRYSHTLIWADKEALKTYRTYIEAEERTKVFLT
jgi:hypothetical protein